MTSFWSAILEFMASCGWVVSLGLIIKGGSRMLADVQAGCVLVCVCVCGSSYVQVICLIVGNDGILTMSIHYV